MYLRTIQRRNKDGTTVRYVQLAHNEWDPAARQAKATVIHSFGREDALDRDALGRLVRSITRYLEPDQGAAATASPELSFLRSRPLGGAWVLGELWASLCIDTAIHKLLGQRRLDPRAERLIFAMVANRALDPMSKLSALEWATSDVAIPGLGEVGEDPQVLYRAMDFLLEIEAELGLAVYWATADLLNLEVDLLFFDTTSTYFEIEAADPPPPRAKDGSAEPCEEEAGPTKTDDKKESALSKKKKPAGFRSYGNSKDHRGDLPQVVVGMAVTRTGIPIRVWCWPGNTADSALIRQVKDDLRSWRLGRVVWVGDRGFSSAENRRYLQRAGGHYIIGEKLRGDSKEATAALARQGRYHVVAHNLRVKEVVIDDGVMRDRFVICHNPEEATRDAAVRTSLIDQLSAAIEGTDRLPRSKRSELAARLRSSNRDLGRYLRTTAGGLLRIDRSAVAREARLDGKFLLRTSDPTLSAEDVALGYKQLLEVERAWRDMKTTLELRPVYHRKEDRIRAHVVLCWLALLLIRIAENAAADTWRNVRTELQRIHLGEFSGSAGRLLQRTQLSATQAKLLDDLKVKVPPRFFELHPVASHSLDEA